MIYDINLAKQRVKALEQTRLARTLADTSDEFQHVFQLITLLLHLNHPSLPGYIINAPVAIADFELSAYQQQYLSLIEPHLTFAELEQQSMSKTASPAILGVYVMGSVASISQTPSSDLDIWLCHSQQLNTLERNKLLQKSLALQSWARKFNVDVNLYLMDQTRFRHFHYADALTTENCGSAQYMLLLEEFYRSAIRLAGKPLLWLHILVEDEKKYDQQVQALVEAGQINLTDWVDFGGLGSLSANEYFGASLWHLYKGIDSPFKAVIKILLLEAYSWQYPHTQLIACQFKQQLLAGLQPSHQFDAYLAMLDSVTLYLQKIHDNARLDFARRCFYVKANENQGLASWRLDLLHHLAQQWGWSESDFTDLNQRDSWKIKRVEQSYNNLVKILMISYRNLISFARKYHVDASIMPQDIGILTRKLYTAFEELPGKVTLLNRQIATDLSEKHLTFIEVKQSTAHKKQGWYVINQAPVPEAFSHLRYIEYNPNLNKLVAWAYFNGLLTANTVLHISSQNVSLEQLRSFVTDLRLSFPVEVPAATDEELYHPCEIRSLVVAVNLVCDPTKKLSQVKTDIQSSDLFNFGSDEESLVGSIDLTYRNLWNEIRTLHFEGSNAILLALKVLSNKIYRGSASPQSVNVFCYSKHYRQVLQHFVATLVNKCISLQVGTALHNQPIKTLRVAGRNWQFFFEPQGLNLQEIPEPKIKRNIESIQLDNALVETEKPKYPYEIDTFASEGFLQFFFEDNQDKTFNVYILDEQNRLEMYSHCDGDKEKYINEINRMYHSSGENKGDNPYQPYQIVQRDFNYPQFYQLHRFYDHNKILPFYSKLNEKK